jgi:sulfur carrier protein
MITVNGEAFNWREGLTVRDILDEKNYTFRMLSVWIDDEPAAARDAYSVTIVPDNARVEIIHMIGGG